MNCRLVSKRWSTIATEVLYSDVYFSRHSVYSGDIQKFLITIISDDNQKGQHLRKFQLECKFREQMPDTLNYFVFDTIKSNCPNIQVYNFIPSQAMYYKIIQARRDGYFRYLGDISQPHRRFAEELQHLYYSVLFELKRTISHIRTRDGPNQNQFNLTLLHEFTNLTHLEIQVNADHSLLDLETLNVCNSIKWLKLCQASRDYSIFSSKLIAERLKGPNGSVQALNVKEFCGEGLVLSSLSISYFMLKLPNLTKLRLKSCTDENGREYDENLLFTFDETVSKEYVVMFYDYLMSRENWSIKGYPDFATAINLIGRLIDAHSENAINFQLELRYFNDDNGGAFQFLDISNHNSHQRNPKTKITAKFFNHYGELLQQATSIIRDYGSKLENLHIGFHTDRIELGYNYILTCCPELRVLEISEIKHFRTTAALAANKSIERLIVHGYSISDLYQISFLAKHLLALQHVCFDMSPFTIEGRRMHARLYMPQSKLETMVWKVDTTIPHKNYRVYVEVIVIDKAGYFVMDNYGCKMIRSEEYQLAFNNKWLHSFQIQCNSISKFVIHYKDFYQECDVTKFFEKDGHCTCTSFQMYLDNVKLFQ